MQNRDVRPASPESFRGKGRSKHSAPGLAVTSVAQATIDRPFPGRAPLKIGYPALRTGLLSSGPLRD
jgi:hypothetical protein